MNHQDGQLLARQYKAVSNLRGLFDMLVHWGAILLIFLMVDYSENEESAGVWLIGIWLYPLSILVIAGLQNSLASLAHEAFHYKAFTSKKMNDVVGGGVYGYALMLPYQHYRKRHLEHHQKVGSKSDPDWVNYQGEQFTTTASTWKFLLGKLFGAYLFVNVYSLLSGKNPPVLMEQGGDKPTKDFIYIMVVQSVLFLLISVLFSWWMYFIFWLCPLFTLTSFLIGVRAYLEHNSQLENAVVEDRLFDFHPNWLEHFFVSPCHFNLHAIHHAYPAVPHYRLEILKAELAKRGIGYPGVDRKGYFRTFID